MYLVHLETLCKLILFEDNNFFIISFWYNILMSLKSEVLLTHFWVFCQNQFYDMIYIMNMFLIGVLFDP